MAKLLNEQSVGFSQRVNTAVRTRDTFQNFATKTGIGTDNLSSDNSYGFNPISRVRTLIEWMYRGSWLCGVGVDCVADDMTREGVELFGDIKPKDMEDVQSMMRSMQIWQSLNQVGKWARLYGGAVGVIVIDGQKLNTELRIDSVEPGQFRGVIPMDRWMLTPDLNTVITQPGPEFGNPAFYTVDASSPNFPIARQRVHYSRMIRMEGVELPYWQKVSENMWGISVLERLFDRLTAFDSATQGAAQLAYRSYLRTISIENLREIIGSGGQAYDALVANINMIRMFQSNEGLTLIDAKDKFEGHSYSFAGLSDIINSMGDQISGALQIPLTRLFGQAPAGLNATGESDMRTYYDNILRLQERWFRRPLDIVIRLVAKNAGVDLEEGWSYEFKSLWQLTDVQKSEVNSSDVTALVNAQSTGVLPSSVFLKELRNSGKKTGMWSSITDEHIKDAENTENVPSPEDLMGGAILPHEEGKTHALSEIAGGNPLLPKPAEKEDGAKPNPDGLDDIRAIAEGGGHEAAVNGMKAAVGSDKSDGDKPEVKKSGGLPNLKAKKDPEDKVPANNVTNDAEGAFTIEAPANNSKGWRRVPDTNFSTKEAAEAYGRKYHTGNHGEVRFRVVPNSRYTADASRIMDVQDIPIYIENPRSTMRKGGKGQYAWETMMPADYGFIEGVPSAEGAFEQLDCYVGDNTASDKVWIIDQLDLRSKGFDEHKCMIGFNTKDEVMDIYERAFSDGKGKDRIGAISEVKMDAFKSWMKTGDFLAPYALVV